MGLSINRSFEVSKEEEPFFKKGIYKSQKISCVVAYETSYLKIMLIS